jgi:hypothetical protein
MIHAKSKSSCGMSARLVWPDRDVYSLEIDAKKVSVS